MVVICIIIIGIISVGVTTGFGIKKVVNLLDKTEKAKEYSTSKLKLSKISDFYADVDFYDNIIECDGGYIIDYYSGIVIIDKNQKDITNEIIKNQTFDIAYANINEKDNHFFIGLSGNNNDSNRLLILDNNLKVILDLYGAYTRDYYDDTYIIEMDGKYKVFDLEKEQFVGGEYQAARLIGSKYIRVQTNNGVGIIDKNGKEIIAPIYDKSEKTDAIYYSDYYVTDDIIVLHKNNKQVLINLSDKNKNLEVLGKCNGISGEKVYCVDTDYEKEETTINVYSLKNGLMESIVVEHSVVTPDDCGESTSYIGVTNSPYFKSEDSYVFYNDLENDINVINDDNKFVKFENVVDFIGNPFDNSKGYGLLIKQKSENVCSVEDNKGKVIVDSFDCFTEKETCDYGYSFNDGYIMLKNKDTFSYYSYDGELLLDNAKQVCNKDDKCLAHDMNDYDNYKIINYAGDKKDYSIIYSINDNYAFVRDKDAEIWYKDGKVVDLKGNILISDITNADLYGDIFVVERWKDENTYIKYYYFYDKDMKEIKNEHSFINHVGNFFIAEDGIYKLY